MAKTMDEFFLEKYHELEEINAKQEMLIKELKEDNDVMNDARSELEYALKVLLRKCDAKMSEVSGLGMRFYMNGGIYFYHYGDPLYKLLSELLEEIEGEKNEGKEV